MELIDKGRWLPRSPLMDAAAHVQVARFLLMLQSTDIDDRYALLGATNQDIVDTSVALYTASIGLLDGGERPSRMSPVDFHRLIDAMTVDTLRVIDVQVTNSVVDMADFVVVGAGATVLFEEIEASLTAKSDRTAFAGFTLAFAARLWAASPFRADLAASPEHRDG